MMFKSAIIASLLALSALSSAASLKYKRTTQSVTLYGYGDNANGGPVFYADGKSFHYLCEPK
jgi:hypothetical protein